MPDAIKGHEQVHPVALPPGRATCDVSASARQSAAQTVAATPDRPSGPLGQEACTAKSAPGAGAELLVKTWSRRVIHPAGLWSPV
jgi:hypothetical protein